MENAAGVGTVTSEMVEARARELAEINGRPSSVPSEADYQQAKRELTGAAEMDSQEESSESVPDSEGWDPVPGSRKESPKPSTIKCVRHPGQTSHNPLPRAVRLPRAMPRRVAFFYALLRGLANSAATRECFRISRPR